MVAGEDLEWEGGWTGHHEGARWTGHMTGEDLEWEAGSGLGLEEVLGLVLGSIASSGACKLGTTFRCGCYQMGREAFVSIAAHLTQACKLSTGSAEYWFR